MPRFNILWGTDNIELLTGGTIEEFEYAVKENPSNKLENLVAMLKFARKYEKY